jgi:hypothetical protein
MCFVPVLQVKLFLTIHLNVVQVITLSIMRNIDEMFILKYLSLLLLIGIIHCSDFIVEFETIFVDVLLSLSSKK